MDIQNSAKKYHSSNSLVYSCQYHVIFTPKYRRKVLINGVDVRLKEYIMAWQNDLWYEVLGMEIMPDHVHLLLDVCPKPGIASVIGSIKGRSSSLLREEFPWLKTKLPTLWTRSKFISTVGSVSLETVKKYIENQKNV